MFLKRYKSLLFGSMLCAALCSSNVAAMQRPHSAPATPQESSMQVIDSKEARKADATQTANALGKKLIECIADALFNILGFSGSQYQEHIRALEGTILTLLNQKANLHVCQTRQLDGETVSVSAIHLLAHHSTYLDGLKPCLELLIRAGVNVNAKASNGKTALHYAVGDNLTYHEASRLDIIKMLVHAGAALNACDNKQRTAYHIALEATIPNIVEYLIEVGAAPGLPYSKNQYQVPSTTDLYQFLRRSDDHSTSDNFLNKIFDEFDKEKAKKMRSAIECGLKKRTAWTRIAPLIAFYRANAKHPFQDSILTLIPDGIAPFLDGEKKKQDKNKLTAKLWETRGVVNATYIPLEQMFEEEKAEEAALKQNAQKIQPVKKSNDQQ